MAICTSSGYPHQYHRAEGVCVSGLAWKKCSFMPEAKHGSLSAENKFPLYSPVMSSVGWKCDRSQRRDIYPQFHWVSPTAKPQDDLRDGSGSGPQVPSAGSGAECKQPPSMARCPHKKPAPILPPTRSPELFIYGSSHTWGEALSPAERTTADPTPHL